MSATIVGIKEKAGNEIKPCSVKSGCFILINPVILLHKKENKIVNVISVDESGVNPNTIYTLEFLSWQSVEDFEFPPTEQVGVCFNKTTSD